MKKAVIALVVAGVAGAGYFMAQSQANSEFKNKLDSQIAQVELEGGVKVSYQDASYALLSGDIVIENLALADQAGKQLAVIDEVQVIGYSTDKISEYTEFNATNISFPGFSQELSQIDPELADLKVNLNSVGTFDEASGDSHFDLALEAKQFSRIQYKMDLGNSQSLMEASLASEQMSTQEDVTLQQQLQLQTQLLEAVQQLHPKGVSLSLDNQSELVALFDKALEQKGMDREMVASMVQNQLHAVPLTEEDKAQLVTFVKNFNALDINLKVEEDVTFQQLVSQAMPLMADPVKLKEYFNLEIAAK